MGVEERRDEGDNRHSRLVGRANDPLSGLQKVDEGTHAVGWGHGQRAIAHSQSLLKHQVSDTIQEQPHLQRVRNVNDRGFMWIY